MPQTASQLSEGARAALESGKLGIIAGSGSYPVVLAGHARAAGVAELAVAAFHGETSSEMGGASDHIEWMRVGQLGRLIGFFQKLGVRHAVMAGQIAPGNLFELRPDLKALLLLGRLKTRNAETIFGAIADELASAGVTLLNATTFMEGDLAAAGAITGQPPSRRLLADIAYGMEIAREISRLDIGQTVVVRHGTVLAVEGFDGTNETIRRGGALGRGKAVVVKVAKPDQDFRFDVPVVGEKTIEACRESGVAALALEADRTLLLGRDNVIRLAREAGLALYGASYEQGA